MHRLGSMAHCVSLLPPTLLFVLFLSFFCFALFFNVAFVFCHRDFSFLFFRLAWLVHLELCGLCFALGEFVYGDDFDGDTFGITYMSVPRPHS